MIKRKNIEEKQKKREQKIKATLQHIIDLFKSGDVPKAIAIGVFPPYKGIPSSNWSLSNRILQQRQGSDDSRGFKQWQLIGRKVKKGARAINILAPRILKIKDEKKNCSEDREKSDDTSRYRLVGYVPVSVFKFEDTMGKEVEYTPIKLPDFPLMNKAKQWGITVKGVTFLGYKFGSYNQAGVIELATDNEKTYFHELAHVAHEKVLGSLKSGQVPSQEIVAELAAQTLAFLVGKQIKNSTLGNSYAYISKYAKEMKKDIGSACISVLGDVEKVLNLLLDLDRLES